MLKMITGSVRVERRIHKGWIEMKEAEKKINAQFSRPIFKKYQYIYSSDKGEISLVQFYPRKQFYHPFNWEIYCLKGNLFNDIQRFTTKKEAEKYIFGLLE